MKLLAQTMCTGTVCTALAIGTIWAGSETTKADETKPITKDHRIGYVQTRLNWSVYQTADGKTECPQGINNNTGPREDFKALYPNGGPVAGTQLAREGLKAFPQDKPAQFPYVEAQGDIAIGLNLDGKVGPRDFTSPEGEKGIDNAFYRVIGCTDGFRGPDGLLAGIGKNVIVFPSLAFMRMIIEINGVDSLENDSSVEVTIARGRDAVVLDTTGIKVAAGGSQRLDDTRYGRKLIQHLHGRIENGVLTTDPIKEGVWPWQLLAHGPRILRIHDMRLRLKLSPTNADGQLAGYFDLDSLYHWLTIFPTRIVSGAHVDPPEFYWAIHRNADAYPDKNGVMTAISAAITLNMTQVFVIHPDAGNAKQVAAIPAPEVSAGH